MEIKKRDCCEKKKAPRSGPGEEPLRGGDNSFWEKLRANIIVRFPRDCLKSNQSQFS